MSSPGLFDEPVDYEAMAWLCDMAARGCIHENKSKYAAQLFRNAVNMRRCAAELRDVHERELRRRAAVQQAVKAYRPATKIGELAKPHGRHLGGAR